MSEKHYTLPSSQIGLFFYHWREWGFRLAWSMLTKPKQWEPVPVDYHVHDETCPEADGSRAYQAGFEHAIALIKGENK